MKKFYSLALYFCIAAMALSCQQTAKETTAPVSFEGNWLSLDYLDLVQQNHSPKQTLENTTFYVTEIRMDARHRDSVVVYNGQMGYASLPAARRGDTLRIKLNQDAATDLAYDAASKTLFFVDKKLNRVFRFVRADSSLIDQSYEMPIAFPAAVNRATLAGTWEVIEDGKTEKSAASFSEKGESRGWRDYQTYSVCVNGDCALNPAGDVVTFTKGTTNHAFGFRSKGDTLTLFDLKPQGNLWQQGKPVALFIRKK